MHIIKLHQLASFLVALSLILAASLLFSFLFFFIFLLFVPRVLAFFYDDDAFLGSTEVITTWATGE